LDNCEHISIGKSVVRLEEADFQEHNRVVGRPPIGCAVANSHRCAVLLKINQRVHLAQVMVCRDKGVKNELILVTQHRRIARSQHRPSLLEQIVA
jgi:hypothetical protein